MSERKYVSHKEHNHPHTKAGNAACRRVMGRTGEPLSIGEEELPPVSGVIHQPGATRGQKAAATRARNKAAEAQTQMVDAIVKTTDAQTTNGMMSLTDWRYLIESLEGAEQYLTGFGTLVSVRLEVVIGDQPFVAEYADHEWQVGAK